MWATRANTSVSSSTYVLGQCDVESPPYQHPTWWSSFETLTYTATGCRLKKEKGAEIHG